MWFCWYQMFQYKAGGKISLWLFSLLMATHFLYCQVHKTRTTFGSAYIHDFSWNHFKDLGTSCLLYPFPSKRAFGRRCSSVMIWLMIGYVSMYLWESKHIDLSLYYGGNEWTPFTRTILKGRVHKSSKGLNRNRREETKETDTEYNIYMAQTGFNIALHKYP